MAEVQELARHCAHAQETPVMKRFAILFFSIVAGWVLGTLVDIVLIVAGLDFPAWMATTYSQYTTYSGALILLLTVFFSWAVYQVLGRRFLGHTPDSRPFLERLPSAVRHPSVKGLVVIWVIAVFTVIGYPVAVYASWRFYVEWRDTQSKICPRCAERIKAAARVCRHCSQTFDVTAAGNSQGIA